MKRTPLATWVFANALGLSVGFLAVLQTGFLLQFGLRTELHWTPQALGQGVSIYARLVGLLAGGALLGCAQTLVLRRHSVRVLPWVLCTAAGFGLVVPAEKLQRDGVVIGLNEPLHAAADDNRLQQCNAAAHFGK